jgi:hypothetical protein
VTYVGYVFAEPFPPSLVRLVPFCWLLGALLGGSSALRALTHPPDRPVALGNLAISVPNTLGAGLFAMGALLGD